MSASKRYTFFIRDKTAKDILDSIPKGRRSLFIESAIYAFIQSEMYDLFIRSIRGTPPTEQEKIITPKKKQVNIKKHINFE